MPTLFEKAARWTKDRLDLRASICVTIVDGAEKISIDAAPGDSNFAALNLEEYQGSEKTFDWIVSAEDLKFSGQKREPKTGWELWQPLADGRRAVYHITPGNGPRAFDVMDHLGVLLRIHSSLSRIEQV